MGLSSLKGETLSEEGWGRFAISFLAALAVFLALSAEVNVGIDTDGLYHRDDGAMDRYIDSLPQPFIPQERSFKLRLATRANADCVVWGSSRAMQIDGDSVPNLFRGCRRVANLAVSGASFEDLVATAPKIRGKRIVMELAPWMFRRNADTRWMEERAAYDVGVRATGLSGSSTLDPQVLNLDYLLYNLRSVVWKWRHPQEQVASGATYLPSGRFVYPDERPIIGGAGDIQYKMDNPIIEDAVVHDFGQVLNYLGRNVTLILLPYRECGTICGYLRDVENRAQEFGALGSYRTTLPSRDFRDALHLNLDGLRELFS